MKNCKYCTFDKNGNGETWTDEENFESYIHSSNSKSCITTNEVECSADIDYCPKCGRKLTGDNKSPIKNKFKDYTDNLAEILEAKNKDYGNSFDKTLEKYGLIALAIRLDDKLSRLISLTKGKEQQVKDESLKDTLQDIAGYSILGIKHLDESEDK